MLYSLLLFSVVYWRLLSLNRFVISRSPVQFRLLAPDKPLKFNTFQGFFVDPFPVPIVRN